MSDDKILGDRGRALEDAFFLQEDAKRIEKLKAAKEREGDLADLGRASGITDKTVLGHLADLGVTGETIAAMSLIPLVHVAWANGNVEDDEKKAVLEAAHDKGVDQNGPARDLLMGWLSKEPGTLFTTWREFVATLTANLDSAKVGMLRDQVVGLATDVARSAGGIMGIASISAAEKQALSEIEAAFETK